MIKHTYHIINIGLFIFASILFNCCKNTSAVKETGNEEKGLQTLNFPELGEDTLKASYFADTVQFIPLETTPASLLGQIEHLWMNDSLILIESSKNPLLLFKRNGKFVKQIGSLGRGPGEYNSIINFCVIQDTIYISNPGKNSLLRYTLNGSFCDELRFNSANVYFTSNTENKLVRYNAPEGEIYVYNKGFELPDTIVVEYGVTPGRYKYVIGTNFMVHLQKTPSDLLFYNYISDTVWSIDGNKKAPAYILNIKNKLPFDKQLEFSNGNYTEWTKIVAPYVRIHLIPFTSKMIIIQQNWWSGRDFAIYINNIQTGEMKRYNTTFIYDDIVSHHKLVYNFSSYSMDYLITTMSGSVDDKGRIKGDPSALWVKQLENVQETDNPVLALIKLKKEML